MFTPYFQARPRAALLGPWRPPPLLTHTQALSDVSRRSEAVRVHLQSLTDARRLWRYAFNDDLEAVRWLAGRPAIPCASGMTAAADGSAGRRRRPERRRARQRARDGALLTQAPVWSIRLVTLTVSGREQPMHYAAAQGHEDMCRFLLQHSADPTAMDLFGCTPIDAAARMGHGPLAAILAGVRAAPRRAAPAAAALADRASTARPPSRGPTPSRHLVALHRSITAWCVALHRRVISTRPS
jgi:hypothetical protein